MKIEVVGSGNSWTKRLSTSFIIDDHILIDVPQGSFKSLFTNKKLENIDTVILTHYHSDHWADLHLFIQTLKHKKFAGKLKLFAPEGFWNKYEALTSAFCVSNNFEFAKQHISYSQLYNGKIFKIANLKLTTYEVLHIPNTFGFVIDDGKTKIGFSADTAMCDSLIKLIKKSSHVFIDVSSIELNKNHLSVNEVLNLKKEFENVNFYAIHYLDDVAFKLKRKINIAHDGEIFNF